MDAVAISELIERIAEVRRSSDADRDALTAALSAERQVRAWLDAANADLVSKLSGQVSFPEAAVAEVSRCSPREASRATERAETLDRSETYAQALDDGLVGSGHVDVITRAVKRVEEPLRDELLERIDALLDVAAAATPEQFDRRVKIEVKRLERDDGTERLARQQRSVRMSTWTDDDGMWCVRGRFDPVLGVRLSAAIDRTVEALFAEVVPANCPTDPVEKQRFLRAHAFARIAVGERGGAGGAESAVRSSGRPEYVVMIDATAGSTEPGAPPAPAVEWPIDVEVPLPVLRELMGEGEVVPIIVRNGVVVHAPGEMNLGRSTRLASRAQRRALRAMYPGCCVPGCSVRFDRCKIHHLTWWRHGGRTDLANLIPVCPQHHSAVHDGGWILELNDGRQLTVRMPDGTVRNTGPPRGRAA